MLVGGTVTLELRKNCGVRFAWRAEQLVEHFGFTPGFAYSVDAAKAGITHGLVFVADEGKHVPSENCNAVIQQLASDMVTFLVLKCKPSPEKSPLKTSHTFDQVSSCSWSQLEWLFFQRCIMVTGDESPL